MPMLSKKYVRPFLESQGCENSVIEKAIHELTKAARVQTEDLYDSNKFVYNMMWYGVSVRPKVGENIETVRFIDWKNANNNHFAIAEEVTVKGRPAYLAQFGACQKAQALPRLSYSPRNGSPKRTPP